MRHRALGRRRRHHRARYRSTQVDTLEGRQCGRVVYLNIQPWWLLMGAGTAAVNWLFTGRDE
jgi:hypothetical protein